LDLLAKLEEVSDDNEKSAAQVEVPDEAVTSSPLKPAQSQ